MEAYGQAFRLLRPLLHRLDAETAHSLTLGALKRLPSGKPPPAPPELCQTVFGLHFASPLGLAAGFDKDAEVPDAMLGLGLGFVEIGGVTPLAQPGNPRPRAFRLTRDRAIINRYGLNSAGMEVVRRRLAARRGMDAGKHTGKHTGKNTDKHTGTVGIVGVNIGANKDSRDRTQDYVTLVMELAPIADYLSVNVSSPNTPGLRSLQDRGQLDDLLARVLDARDAVGERNGRACPILLKIAPDLDLGHLDDIVAVARSRRIDGLVVSNTTIARPGTLIEKALVIEAGGLSGRPLFLRSTILLAEAYRRVGGAFPIVGVGGIDSVETAIAKVEAGASLLQLYSALVYEGPALIGAITRGLADWVRREGRPLSALCGCKASDWADRRPI